LSFPGVLLKNVSYMFSLPAIDPSSAGNCSMWASFDPLMAHHDVWKWMEAEE
jgi:hypothetical protein